MLPLVVSLVLPTRLPHGPGRPLHATKTLSNLANSVAARGANALELLSILDEVRSLPFFSQYSIDMLANCAYLDGVPDECEFDECEILPVEPAPDALLERDAREQAFELDAWARMDPPSMDYYDLADYAEGYTGYNGSHVWSFVYDQLAFASGERDEWRDVFDRLLSGVHASITCHVCDGMEDDDACATEFDRRLGQYPDRKANMYFAFALVLTAVREARSVLSSFDYDVGDEAQATKAQSIIASLTKQDILDEPALVEAANLLRESGVSASECVLNSSDDGDWLEESGIWQMRQRSRAMLRLMDCIACGVCRLHGKVCWLGVATALKLIYTHDRIEQLKRVEVASLIVALEKLAWSVRFCAEMSDN